MGLPNNGLNQSQQLLVGMIDFGKHVVKPFLSLGGKQLQRDGKGANELMRLCIDTMKALDKMKKGLK